jgi:hypothetical protein
MLVFCSESINGQASSKALAINKIHNNLSPRTRSPHIVHFWDRQLQRVRGLKRPALLYARAGPAFAKRLFVSDELAFGWFAECEDTCGYVTTRRAFVDCWSKRTLWVLSESRSSCCRAYRVFFIFGGKQLLERVGNGVLFVLSFFAVLLYCRPCWFGLQVVWCLHLML